MFTDDDMRKYLLPLQQQPQGQPFDLRSALGLGTPTPLGTGQPPPVAPVAPVQLPAGPPVPPPDLPNPAGPSLGVGGLTPPPVAPPTTITPPTTAGPKAPSLSTAKGVQADLQNAYAQQQAGVQAEAAAKGEQARVGGQGELAAAEALQQRQQADQALTAEVAAKRDATRQQIDQELADVNKTQIDPNRLVSNMSTVQKIIGAIAIGLGGYASVKGGGSNVALDLIQGQINKDIQAQMVNLQNKREGVTQRATMLQQDIANDRNADEARAKATAALYDVAIRQVNAQVKMLGTQTAAAEGQKLAGELQAKRDETIGSMLDRQASLGIQAGQLQLAKQQAGVENALKFAQLPGQLAGQKLDLEGKVAETALKQAEAYKALHPDAKAALQVDPTVIHAVTNDANGIVRAPAEVAKEVNKAIGLASPIITDIKRLEAINKQISGLKSIIPNPLVSDKTVALRQEASALWINIANNLSVAQGQGQVREGEWSVVKKQIGDPEGWYSALPQLESVAKSLTTRVNSEIEARTGSKLKQRWEAAPSADEQVAALGGKTGATIPNTAPYGAAGTKGLPGYDWLPQGAINMPAPQFPPPSWLKR